MVYFFLILALALFAACFKVLKLMPVTRRIIVDANAAMVTIRSDELSDAEKEAGTQRAAIAMLGSLISVLARSIVCLLVPVLFIWLLMQSGLTTHQETIAAATSWSFIGLSTLAMAGLLVRSK